MYGQIPRHPEGRERKACGDGHARGLESPRAHCVQCVTELACKEREELTHSPLSKCFNSMFCTALCCTLLQTSTRAPPASTRPWDDAKNPRWMGPSQPQQTLGHRGIKFDPASPYCTVERLPFGCLAWLRIVVPTLCLRCSKELRCCSGGAGSRCDSRRREHPY